MTPLCSSDSPDIRTSSSALGIDPLPRAVTSADANSDQCTARHEILSLFAIDGS
jgi:hypothetical protein